MGFGTLTQYLISWSTDKVGKNSTTDGAIRQNEASITQLYSAVDTTAALTANSDDKIATQKAVKAYADALKASFIVGDGTAGRKLKAINVSIEDAADAAKIKVSTIAKTGWANGDVIAAEDNLDKSGSTTSFSLNANGNQLTIKAAALTGNCVAVLMANIGRNASATDSTVYGEMVSNDIVLYFYNTVAGALVDLTTLVDTGTVYAQILYITAA